MPLHRILVTRPLEAAGNFAQKLAQRGFDPIIDPLLEITPLDFAKPQGPFAAILITSANAIPALSRFDLRIPVVTVGEMTRQQAETAGFAARCLGQTVAEAAAHLTGRVLYLSGQDIAHDIPDVTRVPVYAARQMPLKKATIALLSAGEIGWIVLFSRRSAAALEKVVSSMTQQAWMAQTGLVCLSERTAEPVQALLWQQIRIASEPTEAALLATMEGA